MCINVSVTRHEIIMGTIQLLGFHVITANGRIRTTNVSVSHPQPEALVTIRQDTMNNDQY
mgnify:CR=1 FL=1